MHVYKVHSNCLDTYTINPRNGRCTFRDMKCMVLPPVTVSMLVKEVEQGDEVTVAGGYGVIMWEVVDVTCLFR